MKIPSFVKFLLLILCCLVIFTPTYPVYSYSTEEHRMVYTSVTFFLCFLVCCLVSNLFVEEEQVVPRMFPTAAPISQKSEYIKALPRMSAIPKQSTAPTAVGMELNDFVLREQNITEEILKKQQALLLESDPLVQANLKDEIAKLNVDLVNAQQASKLKHDMERKRVSSA
ncbi:hypothetical protein EIN_312820 [Entamoeba invadens IP1]|uniref:Uncharacterized protein n=1 Tax=Entamoeba invadens IP1 TaxID=370355 RepID=A0A0A1UFR8_ENTIV|nr:hypothetical protein EIN_312820 [Entamoeba invadens IP1]ELP92910.1 hypothetical protein EIN_312820 [Entamoeba invadens IP1]|eukprot:XP_004259681.1 hypothetical protein EIN_312820 [Entamoeba invadens IP1]